MCLSAHLSLSSFLCSLISDIILEDNHEKCLREIIKTMSIRIANKPFSPTFWVFYGCRFKVPSLQHSLEQTRFTHPRSFMLCSSLKLPCYFLLSALLSFSCLSVLHLHYFLPLLQPWPFVSSLIFSQLQTLPGTSLLHTIKLPHNGALVMTAVSLLHPPSHKYIWSHVVLASTELARSPRMVLNL